MTVRVERDVVEEVVCLRVSVIGNLRRRALGIETFREKKENELKTSFQEEVMTRLPIMAEAANIDVASLV